MVEAMADVKLEESTVMVSSYSVNHLPFVLGAVLKLFTTVVCPGIVRVISALDESE
jgi:hypothetical protein